LTHRQVVIAGLDPAIHLLRNKLLAKSMDPRVKPAGDTWEVESKRQENALVSRWRLAMRSDWFLHNWMYAGFLAGLFLLAIAPAFAAAVGLPLLLVYLEEHYDDRFRKFVNDLLAVDAGSGGHQRGGW
jgi:hypothetical protein